MDIIRDPPEHLEKFLGALPKTVLGGFTCRMTADRRILRPPKSGKCDTCQSHQDLDFFPCPAAWPPHLSARRSPASTSTYFEQKDTDARVASAPRPDYTGVIARSLYYSLH
eukprot:6730397-Karenia_brevis.AAC.1